MSISSKRLRIKRSMLYKNALEWSKKSKKIFNIRSRQVVCRRRIARQSV